MSFITRTISKELKSIPFDEAYRIYNDAAEIAEATAEAENTEKYLAYISKLETQWTDTHEAPYEGNFSDEVPYQRTPDLAKIRRRAGQAALITDFIPRYKLDTIMQTWVMPQIIKWLVHKPLRLEEMTTAEGKISGRKIVENTFDRNNAWDVGLYYFLMLDSRSPYIKSQYKGDGRTYCSLVPLIPYAWKLHHNIKYSEWDKNTLDWVVNDSLYRAMTCDVPELTREEILEAREQGLVFKSGVKAGTARSPLSTYKLYDTTGTKLHGMPELAQTMLTQIWCAHPQNRTKYMVLDPKSWDSIPTPLIAESLFPQTKSSYIPKRDSSEDNPDTPWM